MYQACNIEELEGIKLGEPCQLFKSNERNKKLCTKVDYFLLGHKLSWTTAHFVRCNEIIVKPDEMIKPDVVSSSPRKLVP